MNPERVRISDKVLATQQSNAAIPWDEISQQWRGRRFGRLREQVTKFDNASVERVDKLIDGELPSVDPGQVLSGAFTDVSGHRQGPILLAIYVYARCLETWERSGDYAKIRSVLKALRFGANELVRSDWQHSETDVKLLDLAVDQAQHMYRALNVENAIQCSCPVATGEEAGRIVDHVESLLRRMPPARADSNGAMELLRSDLEVTGVYFRKVSEFADSVSDLIDLIEGGKSAIGHFDSVVQSLAEGVQDDAIRGDVYQSELRTHLATAQELNRSLHSPWIRIDAAELVYLYPFALRDLDAERAVERAADDGLNWILGHGVKPVEVGATRLSDRWVHADPPDRPYGGVSLRLPELKVESTAHEPLLRQGIQLDLLGYQAEVRLSRVGNHYLRIRSELRDATLHDLNQALRRASPGMGHEIVTSPGREWSRFVSSGEDSPGYVQEMIAGVAKCLNVDWVGDPTADFHVGVGIRELSIQGSGEESSSPEADDIKTAVGASLLFNPVGSWATSLEEWVRYSAPKVENLIQGAGPAGDLVMRTHDTTVIYMPTSPDWLCREYEEMIEFVAAIPPLLTAWEKRVREHADELEEQFKVLQEGSSDPDKRMKQIHRNEAGLHKLHAEIRRELAELHSPRLVYDRASRAFLDRLWKAAELPMLEASLDRQLVIILTLQQRLAVMASGIAEENRREAAKREQRLERVLELGLGLIAATSLAGLFDWVNSGFEIRELTWVWVEVGLLAGAAAVLAWLILRKRDGR